MVDGGAGPSSTLLTITSAGLNALDQICLGEVERVTFLMMFRHPLDQLIGAT